MSQLERVLERGGMAILEALLTSVRFEIDGQENYQPFWRKGVGVIFVLWHGRLLPLSFLHRQQGLVTLISRSRDGERIARVVERWGYTTVRGSSSRDGGPALRALIRHARAGRSLALTPDGPRGPRQKMKPGPLLAAQLTGLPVVAAAAGTGSAWWFGGWDRFLVPRPFARIRVAYSAPRWIPRDATADELAEHGRFIEADLDSLLKKVDGSGSEGRSP